MSYRGIILTTFDHTPNGKKSMLLIVLAILLVIATVFGVLLLG